MTIEELVGKIRDAQSWDTADWTHERLQEQDATRRPEEFPVYCEGGDESCATCSAAAQDAALAHDYGDTAIAALRNGDYGAAVEALAAAEALEREYGDSPLYGPALRDVREAQAAN